MHTIVTRRPTSDEQQVIENCTRPDIASYGCLTLLFGIAPTLMLGALGWWLGGVISPLASKYGAWIGGVTPVVGFVFVLVRFQRVERRQRRRAWHDLAAQTVQEIHVTDARVLEIGLINDNAPILAFDIGGNKILYLQGQWLRNGETYGAQPLEGDPYDEFINGFPEPHSFPSTEFTITRFPISGEVVGIRVAGKYLAPAAEVEALRREYEFGPSEVFDGSIDDIVSVLAREHERRKANSSAAA